MTNKIISENDINCHLKQLSDTDFQELGNGQIAYIREISFLGQTRYVVYDASGEQISVDEQKDEAISHIQERDMQAVTLQ